MMILTHSDHADDDDEDDQESWQDKGFSHIGSNPVVVSDWPSRQKLIGSESMTDSSSPSWWWPWWPRWWQWPWWWWWWWRWWWLLLKCRWRQLENHQGSQQELRCESWPQALLTLKPNSSPDKLNRQLQTVWKYVYSTKKCGNMFTAVKVWKYVYTKHVFPWP